jgi:ABC-type branched-subunit amino acid transport system permease subunit
MGGHYLPLGTIAWGISLYFPVRQSRIPRRPYRHHRHSAGVPVRLELKSSREFYYLIWVVVLLAILALRNLLDSREGRAIRALKGGTVMAEAMGVNTPRVQDRDLPDRRPARQRFRLALRAPAALR